MRHGRPGRADGVEVSIAVQEVMIFPREEQCKDHRLRDEREDGHGDGDGLDVLGHGLVLVVRLHVGEVL